MDDERRVRGSKRRVDLVEGVAVGASLLCLLHCLALPLFLLMLPGIVAWFAASEAAHVAALLLVVPSALIAFLLGYRRHRAALPAILGVTGIACLVTGVLPVVAPGAGVEFTVAGSLLLVVGHMINWRLRARMG